MRWAESVENFRSQGVTLCGDVLLISAFVSYVGYFTKKYRNELMEKFWIPYINKLKVSVAMTQRLRGSPQGRYATTLHPHWGSVSLLAGADIISGMLQSCFFKHWEGRLLLEFNRQLMWPGPTSGPGYKVSPGEMMA